MVVSREIKPVATSLSPDGMALAAATEAVKPDYLATVKAETLTMQRIARMVDKLPHDSQRRVAAWLASRFAPGE